MTVLIGSVDKLERRAAPISQRLKEITAPVMAEVGVDMGKLSSLLLERHGDLTIYAIDNWIGREQQPSSYIATGDGHARLHKTEADSHMMSARSRLFRFGNRAIIKRLDSVIAAAGFDDGEMDMVFLDGRHDYVGVADDIAAWWPKVRAGGWLCGDDYDHRDDRFRFGVQEAVDEWITATGLTLELHDGGVCMSWFVRKP